MFFAVAKGVRLQNSMFELSLGDRVWRMLLMGRNYFAPRIGHDLSDLSTVDDLPHLPL